jgi:hypothetical protein
MACFAALGVLGDEMAKLMFETEHLNIAVRGDSKSVVRAHIEHLVANLK